MLGQAIFGEAIGAGESRPGPSRTFPYQGLFGATRLPADAVRRAARPAEAERRPN